MSLKEKIQEAYLLRAKDAIAKNNKNSDLAWLDDALNDFEAADARNEIMRLAWDLTAKGEEFYPLAIKAYRKADDKIGLIELGKGILAEVKTAIISEETDSPERKIFGSSLNRLLLAVDAFEAAGTEEAKQHIEEIATISFENKNFDLGISALEKGEFYGRLAILADKALSDGDIDAALDLYKRAQAKEALTEIGDLLVCGEKFEKAEAAYRESGNKEKLKFLMEIIAKKKKLSPGEYDLLFRLSKETGENVSAEQKDRLLDLALSTKDFSYINCAVNNLFGSRNLVKLGDVCIEKGLYTLAVKAYEIADKVKKILIKIKFERKIYK